ncbi:MAG: DUF4010 domain-containing protein [Bacteroidetes bacterium]|nr:DUF4010 domain-containing protein [Bacteroidota bacterium]
MGEEILQLIPPSIIKFLLVALFSLLIGLEQRRHYIKEEFESRYGTDRTFTLIGIFGFILYIISPQTLIPFLAGGFAITLLLAIYYFQKIAIEKKFGATSLVIALITYCLAPLVYTQPNWLVLLIVVCVLVLTEIKETLFQFSEKFDSNEFITLAKFLVLAGVILPLLPDKAISPDFNFSPYKFWLAIVAVSGISYFSYLLKKFVFPNSGIILTGILGGMYSSTATTIILARKSKELPENNKVVAAIVLATTMMYVRLFLLALFFNKSIALQLAPSFAIFVVVSSMIALYFLYFQHKEKQLGDAKTFQPHNNPLEFKTALLFSALFIFFAIATGSITKKYGTGGINVLSFVVGVTDIDPFILNLFQSKWNIENSVIVMAVLNAVTSNNLLKMVYGISLSDKSIRWQLIVSFGMLIVLGLLMSFVFHF